MSRQEFNDDFISLPLHIKGEVVDFRDPRRRVAPWDAVNVLPSSNQFSTLFGLQNTQSPLASQIGLAQRQAANDIFGAFGGRVV